MSQRLKDKVAIITGAGLGIGHACAVRFAAEGARVVVNDISAKLADATVAAITEQGGEAIAVEADVTDAAQVQSLVNAAVSHFGRLDILMNNAGGAIPNDYHDADLDEYQQIMDKNLHSVHYGIRAAIPVMVKQGGGCILSVSSGAGLGYVGGLSIYGSAKAGLTHLTRGIDCDKTFARLFRGNGIHRHGKVVKFPDLGQNPFTSSIEDRKPLTHTSVRGAR